eukprot:3011512-Amphidinium_carterae.1
MMLRGEVARILHTAHERHQVVAGQTVGAWAREAGLPVQEFLSGTDTAPFRLGTSFDGHIAALILGTS